MTATPCRSAGERLFDDPGVLNRLSEKGVYSSCTSVITRRLSECRECFGPNFAHYWWYDCMSRDEYWRKPWRRAYGNIGQKAAARD
ncbi:MAG: hypothetical protein OER43_18520 [Gammaproteobacteria bacterium]|nr:hypothetical protein [Gammaproteobacteria bacterium]